MAIIGRIDWFQNWFESPGHLSAGRLEAELLQLKPDGRGYITSDEYEEITGEPLDDFSVTGRKMIGEMAARARCTIAYAPQERRVYFTRNQH